LPIYEPGLLELIEEGVKSGNLEFGSNLSEPKDIEVLWIAYDTPVNNQDVADTSFVINQTLKSCSEIKSKKCVSIFMSSQLPIGSIKLMEAEMLVDPQKFSGAKFRFISIPENLRLGSSIRYFLNPDRFIVGIRSEDDKKIVSEVLGPITPNIEYMSIESAEMTKHAINAFLATSVVFANEIAKICELTGADAKEVERGIKTDMRIGGLAYVAPGLAFAGGTLARDITYLEQIAKREKFPMKMLSAVKLSNNLHKKWIHKKITSLYKSLDNLNVTIWGLTYKSNTNTLRRSHMVELADWLLGKGVKLTICEPSVKNFPKKWGAKVKFVDHPFDSIKKAEVLIVGRLIEGGGDPLIQDFLNENENISIIDPSRLLVGTIGCAHCYSIGSAYGQKV
jgi:UDPglucose 6-dehydrogenase